MNASENISRVAADQVNEKTTRIRFVTGSGAFITFASLTSTHMFDLWI